ncbi:hypothetical protein [Pseudonocardia sp.]|uniref:hypothetical protein n=1 Tax=Pseudonocardia sp. TaxID=60912 RepID=UPI0031FD7080
MVPPVRWCSARFFIDVVVAAVTSSVVTSSAGTISVVATVLGAAPALLTEPECLLAPARFGPLDHPTDVVNN